MLPRLLSSSYRIANRVAVARVPRACHPRVLCCHSSHSLATTSTPKTITYPLLEASHKQQEHSDSHHESRYRFARWLGVASTTAALSIIIGPGDTDSGFGTGHKDLVDDGGNYEPPQGDKPAVFNDLHQAVLDGDERRVRQLIKKCTPKDVNYRHEFGWQMLHVAAVHGRSRICELLLQHGAHVNGPDQYSSPTLMGRQMNMDPLLVSLTREDQFHPDLVRLNFQGSTALHYAAISNSVETVEVLAKYGADPSIRNIQGYKPVNFAQSPSITKFLKQYERDYSTKLKELEEEERRRYPLEDRVRKHIIGQEAAINMVAATIRRKENGWFDGDHPLVFLFLGSSGVGKTELAKQVAKYLHKDNKDAFVRLDMSEYQEQHTVARMIGSPPGYVGHQDGGQLTEALKKCNNAVVLFDEIEKAHPKVLTVLLQLFDEGRLTDGRGKTIECKDAIFIMTSNLASEAIASHAVRLREELQAANDLRMRNAFAAPSANNSDNEEQDDNSSQQKQKEQDTSQSGSLLGKILSVGGGGGGGKEQSEQIQDYEEHVTISRMFKDTIVRPILKAGLKRDEFLGRINEMVYFLPFSERELRLLVKKELAFWADVAKRNNNIDLSWDEDVVDVLAKGYDIHYGARSIKHEIERRLVNEISEMHTKNKNVSKMHISVKDGNKDLIVIKAK